MGGADIIPGVSGGTVALILGIYERLVSAISHIDARFLGLVARREFPAAAKHIDLRFLLALGCGIAIGIVSLASLMNHLLAEHRAETLAAFFGLILGSSLIVGQLAGAAGGGEKSRAILLGAIGAGLALFIVTRQSIGAQPGLAYTFVSGAIAICAMILPGISGAYILLLLGKYVEITGIIKRIPKLELTGDDLLTLAVFAAGCAIGLIAFSKLLRWLLSAYHVPTMAILCGFMLGSLYKIWPFQRDLDPTVEEIKHKQFTPYLPQELTGEVFACLCIGLTALVAVLVLDRLVGPRAQHRAD